MRARHELSRSWRGAPWGRRLTADWGVAPTVEPAPRHAMRTLALAVLLGLATGVMIAGNIARDDRTRFAKLMAAVETD